MSTPHAGTAWLSELGSLFERRLGHGIAPRNLEHLEELVTKLTERCGIGSPEQYVSFVRSLPMDSPLVQALLHEMVNKESYFFRDPPTMASLRNIVLPRLLDAASHRKVFRVWSAGCSTGEELYTLSILLDELITDYESWNIALVGTDIDTFALARARRGEYREWSLRSTDPEQRRRYFGPGHEPGWVQIRSRYRRNVSFAFHNLADPGEPLPWPGAFDLILCRNVAIYFSGRACRDLGKKLVSALAPGGSWIAGPSDPVMDAGTEYRVMPGLVEHRVTPSDPDATDHGVRPSSRPALAPISVAPERVAALSQPVIRSVREPAPSPLPKPIARPTRPAQAASIEPELVAQLESARAYADAGNFVVARGLLDAIILRNTLFADSYLLSASIHEAQGDDARAESDLRRLLYLEPSSIEGQFRMGLVQCRRGDRDGAIRALRNAVALSASQIADNAHAEWLQHAAAHQLAALLREKNDV